MNNLDQNRPKPVKAFEDLGYAFVKIPRRLLWLLFKGAEEERQWAMLYLVLFTACAYEEGTFSFADKLLRRKKGQWIGTLAQLQQMTSLSQHRVRVALEKLTEDRRIRIDHIYRGIRVTVVGYAEYTATEEKAPRETPQERAAREYCEMMDKLNRGSYV